MRMSFPLNREEGVLSNDLLYGSIASWGDGVMAPPPLPLRHYAPSHVTEDTPPDLLEGTMELEVTLPNGKSVVMTVHRSTPMMDLLIQVTTAHRINPGGHVIQVVSDNIFLSYKPSTPIGTLDTNAIKIVAKNTLNEKAKARKNNLQQQAIERNIRLKVNLPRNQLAVYRVPPKSLIGDIFDMVCRDKSLDPELHEIRHPVNVDERLRGSCSLSDYQLHEVCIVSSDFRPPPLSVTDLITMSSIAHPEDKKRRGFLGLFARKAKSSTGDSSVSSGSAGERSVSPARSDESIEGRPHIPHGSQGLTPASSSATITGSVNNSVSSITATAGGSSNQRHSADDNSESTPSSARLSRPVSTISLNKNKKRQAPIPPQRVKRTTESHTQNGKINGTTEKRSLSRHSSDSSGYHEPEIRSSHASPSNSEVSSFEATRNFLPPTNLMSVPSVSSLSVASSKGGKRKAPSPPKIHTKGGPSAIPESPEEMDNTQTKVNNEEQSKMTNSQPPKTNSSVSESVPSNVKDGDSENKALVVPTKDQEQLKVNGFSSHSYSDGSKSAENMKEELNVNDQSTVSNSSTLSSNSDHKETSVNLENIVKEKDSGDPSLPDTIPVEDIHNEAHILEPHVDPVDTPLDSSSVNHIKSTVEPKSSQPPGPGATENEDETRTVSLSSETSNTSVEMLNPKDIQRPKRHRRKKIPEAFMNVSENVSDSSNSPKSMESLERVEDLAPMIGSNPSQTIFNSEEDSQNVSVEENSSDHVVTNDKESLNENDVEFLKEVPEGEQITPETKEPEVSKLAVVYVEDVNIEESSTDPVSPSQERKPIYTSKVQLASVGTTETKSQAVSYENSSIDRRSVSVTQIISKTPTTNSSNPETWKDDVIAELKSAIGSSSDEKTDRQQARILNCKPKEFNCGKPSDYNLILSFKKTGSSTDTPIPRSDSTSSYDSADTGSLPVETDSLKKSRSSTETSYESAPPPPPDTLPPLPSDSESKASSSVVSRQSSFGEQDVNGGNFVKPPTPAFSISTYQSRASKISYDKKLSRSESLASFNDFHTTDGGESKEVDDGRKVWRSDSQRNEVFKSDELKKKSTSTTFLNLAVATASSEWSDKVNNESNIRPSLLKSQSKTSLVDSDSRENSLKRHKEGNLKFEVQSAKEADSTINKPLWKSYSNLRKAKSSLDVRGNEGRMQDPSLQGIPDSGLASEYMRLQDDFMKWQQQLLQNQQLLHTRVAPIAANPPTLNNVGIVTNLNHSNTPPAASQPRKPVEITIPIRFEDSDEEKDTKETTPAVKQNQRLSEKPSNVSQTSPGTTGTRWVSPNVMVESWQGRPPGGPRFQSNVGEPQTQARSFVGPQRMQTVFQSVPSGKQGPPSQTGFQQVPQPTFDQAPPQSSYQNVPQPGFQQRQSSQQMPQSNFQQMPQSNFQQMPQSNFQQMPQSNFQQMPQSNFQQMPQSSFQQMPQSNFKQMPQTSFQQVPQSNFQQTNPPTFQQTKPNIVQSPRPEFETEFNQAQNPELKRQNQFGPRVFSQQGGQNIMQQPTSSVGIGDKPDDNINARFSSVVTLSNDDNDSLPKKDKVRSIVQLNNSEAVQGPPSVPSFPSKVIGGKLKSPEADDPGNSPASASNGSASSAAPVSSRLVQQATQQQQGSSAPRGGFRVSPPKFDQPTSSTPKFESRYSPPKTTLYSSPTKVERFSPSKEERSSPQRHEPSPPFANVKLRPVESSRVSPPKVASIPQAPAAAPPPPPPPPSQPNSGPPPPPPPPMSEEDRRTATGKKIFAAANVPQLDAREELMMAIRQFGGSGNLRKSGRAPPR